MPAAIDFVPNTSKKTVGEMPARPSYESLARSEKSATRNVDSFGSDAGKSLRNDGAGVSGFIRDAHVGRNAGACGAGVDGLWRGSAAGDAAGGNLVRPRGAAADHEGFALSHRCSAAFISPGEKLQRDLADDV